jgi:hypothetical protein
MSKYSNSQIAALWAAGKPASSHTGNFSTDGRSIWSYRLCIGETNEQGLKIAHDYTSGGIQYYSQTTSCHVGRVVREADYLNTGNELVELK